MSARIPEAALVVAWVVVAGCSKSGADVQTAKAVDYAGLAGGMFVYTPVGAHESDTGAADTGTADTGTADTGTADTGAAEIPELRLDIGDAEWTFTLGRGVTAFAWSVADGLVVDDSTLLPATVTKGSSGAGVEVTEMGELAVWYGLFPDVASVTVSTGRLSGEWAFARDIGPVRGAFGGEAWELVYYQ